MSLPLATRGQIVLMDFPDEFGVGVCPLASPFPLFPSHLLLCVPSSASTSRAGCLNGAEVEREEVSWSPMHLLGL